MAKSGSLWVKSRMYSLTSTMLRMQYLTYSLYDDIAMREGPMTSAIHGKVRQPLGEIQNVQPHQYHAFLVRMQYLTYSLYDDIAMVLRWEGPMTWATNGKVR